MRTVLRPPGNSAARATITARVPVHYTAGARPDLDLPAHVRAGSALCWVGERLAIVQDDVRCVALLDPARGDCVAVPLAAGHDGARLFDAGRGNKKHKLDLEACVSWTDARGAAVLALGSGSTARRETMVELRIGLEGVIVVREIHAPRFYARLRETTAFAGSELNIEGAVLLDDNQTLRLFQRGNGARCNGLEPIDATIDVDFVALLQGLARDDVAEPMLTNLRQYDLGRTDGARITFTDAARDGDRVMFLASAEDSPDAYNDGPVTGVFVGWIEPSGEIDAMARVLDSSGAPFVLKAEGLALDRTHTGRAWVVLDRDAPDVASDLCTLEFTRG